MYKALYEYKSSLPDYLSFCTGDQFTVLDRANRDWFQAQNGRGQVGYVACTYVKQVQAQSAEVLKFVDWSIEAIHLQAADEGAGRYSSQQRDTLQKLVKHRAEIADKLESTPPLNRSQSEDVGGQSVKSPGDRPNRRQSERRRAPSPPKAKATTQPATTKQPQPPSPTPTPTPPSPTPTPPSPTPTPTPPSTTTILSPDAKSPQPASSDEGLSSTITTNSPCSSHVTPDTDLPPPPLDHQPSPPGSPTCLDTTDLPPPPASLTLNHQGDGLLTDSHVCEGPGLEELLKSVTIPDKIGPELLEEVRKSTGLSFNKSKVAVEIVLGYVGFRMPALEGVVDRLLSSLQLGRDISDEDISSHDAKRLGVIFSELTACKDDSQQRSWALHEDEAVIKEYLEELLSIVENAKPSICRKVVSRDNYDILHNLVQYYQMETRGALCRLLLKTFGALCGLKKEVITQLLYSVLPLELAQELTVHTEDAQRVCFVGLVMTMLFSTGDPVSTAVTEKLDEEFFLHLLRLMENPPSTEFEDEAADVLIWVMLSFNLHLGSVTSNVVLRSLALFGSPKVFTERIMVWLNRGDDPVKMFDFKPASPNAVLKLFLDMYTDTTTSDLLYTNDAKVLMDVIIGRLSNLGPGDQARSQFLVLCQRVVQNSAYAEHCHRLDDLHLCLTTIRQEEAHTPEDKRVADRILTSNPNLFPQLGAC